jgi:hypothetical protein
LLGISPLPSASSSLSISRAGRLVLSGQLLPTRRLVLVPCPGVPTRSRGMCEDGGERALKRTCFSRHRRWLGGLGD